MRSVKALAVAALCWLAAYDVSLAEGPKSGGILRMYHRDSPGSASIHEGATYSLNVPFMPVFNNLVIYNQHVAQNSMDDHPPRAGGELGLERRQQDAHLQAAPGRQMARRQAVHLGRRQMHLRHADGQVAAEVPAEPAQVLVRPGQRRHRQRRLRGLLQPEAAAAGAAGAARLRLYADLSLPCLAGGHAHPPDRHRAVQVRRVQGQRIDQADPQPGLLEEGPALSRRHRVHHHPEPLDRDPRLHRRQVRHDVPDRSVDSAAEGRQIAGAERGLRGEPNNVSTNIIVNSSAPPFDNLDIRRALALALDRKAFISIMFEGQGDIGGTMLPAPAGLWAHAEGDAGDDPRLRPRHQRQPRRGAQADAEGGLWPGQASRGQGLDPQHSDLSRSRRDPDRPAQEHLYRRRARRGRDRATGSRKSRARITRSGSTSPATRSTIPTSRSTRTIPAARSATTPITATRRSRSCSTSNRRRPTSTSARSWCGRSTRSCRRTSPGRSSSTRRTGTCWQPYVKGITVM